MSASPGSHADPLARLAELPAVAEAADAARTAVDRLLRHRLLRLRSAEVTAESARRGARASAQLEGLPAVGGEPPPAVLRLYAELGHLRPAWRRAPPQALARLHVLAARGRCPEPELGRPRPDAVAEDPLGQGPPPPAAEVAGRMHALAQLVLRPTAAPAVVVAAVVHGDLLALRPFPVGNGLVARAASRLVLVEHGLDPRSLAVPEVGHAASVEEYAEAARAYRAGGMGGTVRWLVHCAQAVEAGAREGLAICVALSRG